MISARLNPTLVRYLVLAGADVCAKGMGFVVSIAVIRYFGAAGFGEISFATSVVTYALMIGTCGLDVYAVRSLASAPATLGSLTGTVVAARLLLSAATYVMLLALALLLPSTQATFALLSLFGLSLFTGALSLSWVPEALQKTHVLALANLGTQSLWLVFVLGALALGWGLWTVPTAQVLAEGLAAAGVFAWVLRSIGSPELPQPWRHWGSIIRQSAPIGGAKVMRTVALGSDLVLLGFLVSREELGWYAAAFKLFLLCVSLGALYFVILLPRLAREATATALQREVRASLRRVLLAAIPVTALLALFSTSLLQTVFGASFGIASRSFQVLLLALLANVIGAHFRNTLLVQGRQRLDLCLVTAASLVHVIAKLILIVAVGIEGAAIGTFLGEAVLAALTWLAVRPELTGRSRRAVDGRQAEAPDSHLNPVGV